MTAEQSVEVVVPADLPIVDRRRQVVHAVAMAADKLLSQRKNDPDGLILTVHRAACDSDGYPSLVVTATVPDFSQVKAPIVKQ